MLQAEIDATFHQARSVLTRFTAHDGGVPEALLFFEDTALTQLVGAVALYGGQKVATTLLVCQYAGYQVPPKRGRGYGTDMVRELVRKAKEATKKKLQLMCKPKSSGDRAPEHFFEKVGFERAPAQDKGLLDLNKSPHDRRCKMVMHLRPVCCDLSRSVRFAPKRSVRSDVLAHADVGGRAVGMAPCGVALGPCSVGARPSTERPYAAPPCV